MRSSYQALYDFGHSFLSPLLNRYMREVLKRMQGHRPVCLAREGWIFFKILDHLQQKALIALEHEPVYLKVSRTVLFRSQLGNGYGWDLALLNKFEGTILELVMKRFGLQLQEAYSTLPAELLGFTCCLPDDAEKVAEWFQPHNERLKLFARPTSMALERYLEQSGIASSGPAPLMLDLGYAGTIQKLVTKIINRDTAGVYFITTKSGSHPVGDNVAKMEGVFREDVQWSQGYLMLERSLLLESLMTAPHGQVTDMRLRTDGQIDFFYGRTAAPQRFYQDLEVVMAGAIKGIENGFRLGIEYSVEEAESIYAAFATPPSALPRAARHLFSIDDDFSGGGVINPLELFGL